MKDFPVSSMMDTAFSTQYKTYIIRINSSIGVRIGTGDFCHTYLPATNT
jgi:hypothetical protein